MRDPFTVRRHRRHVGRRVRQRHALQRDHSGCSRRSTTATCSSTPSPDAAAVVRRAPAPVLLPGSSWNDYDRTLLSPGGDVIDRRAKAVTPSKEARVALAIPDDVAEEMTPDELIRWILQAPVDLLWNGGIGTYVKSLARDERRRRRPHEQQRAGQRVAAARAGRRRGRQPRVHAARPDRVRAGGRADQHRLHRQLRGRRHLRPRGELEDPARARDPARRADARGPQRTAAGLRARRRAARPVRQLPAGADPVAGGRGLDPAHRGLRGSDGAARGGRGARARRRVPADDRGDAGAPRRGPGHDPAGAGRAARVREAAGVQGAGRAPICPTATTWPPTSSGTSRP